MCVGASEVKVLYYIDGFADKYKNTSIQYGDYFPG